LETQSKARNYLRSSEEAMHRQYRAARRQGGENRFGVGVFPVGAIFYLQDNA